MESSRPEFWHTCIIDTSLGIWDKMTAGRTYKRHHLWSWYQDLFCLLLKGTYQNMPGFLYVNFRIPVHIAWALISGEVCAYGENAPNDWLILGLFIGLQCTCPPNTALNTFLWCLLHYHPTTYWTEAIASQVPPRTDPILGCQIPAIHICQLALNEARIDNTNSIHAGKSYPPSKRIRNIVLPTTTWNQLLLAERLLLP